VDARRRVKLSLTNRSIGLIPAPAGPQGPKVASARRKASEHRATRSGKPDQDLHRPSDHYPRLHKRDGSFPRASVTWWSWRGSKHPIPSRTRP
jgi:hypothetical protein